MKKKLFHIVNATVLSLIVAILSLELIPRIPFLEPFIDPVMDWDFTDHYYDDFDAAQVKKDTSLVMVNIGMLNRAEIASLISKINYANPKAVGLSVYFEQISSI